MNVQYVEYGDSASRFTQNVHFSSPSPTWLFRTPFSSGPSVLAEYVWFDGELVSFENANVQFPNPSLHIASGVFEGIRCHNTPRGPAVFRLAEHLELFLDRIRSLGVNDFRYDVDELRDIVCRVVQVNRISEGYIRPALYFDSALGLDLAANRPVLGVAAWNSEHKKSQKALENGIRMMVSTFTQDQPDVQSTRTMAGESGFDEAILVDPDGYVADASGESLLLVRNNTIYATPLVRFLEGLTRDTVMALAQDAGYSVTEVRISREQLYGSDEVFVCSTAAELLPVREIDFRPIGSGSPGPITRELQTLFAETIKGQNRRSAEWLDYMLLEPVI